MKRKVLAVILCLAVILSVTLPGTLALSTAQDSTSSDISVGSTETTETTEGATETTVATEDGTQSTIEPDGTTGDSTETTSGETNATEATENVEGYNNESPSGLPACACPEGYTCVLPYDHDATCPLSTGNMQYLTNEQIWQLWQSLTDEQREYLHSIPVSPITEEQWAYIQAQTEKDEDRSSTVTGSFDDCVVTVSGNIPAGVTVSVERTEINRDEFGLDVGDPLIASFDLKLMNGDAEWQPSNGETVTVTLSAADLGMSDGDEFVIYHQHDGKVTISETYVVADGLLTFTTDGFSIYAVIGTYNNDWNYNNYNIVMTVGDALRVSTTTRGSSYSWSLLNGDTSSFTLSNSTGQTATIKANKTGTVMLQCKISTNNWSTIEQMKVVALASVGQRVDDDVIFVNIDKDYKKGDTEYENTYGPYVMKIRFEDTNGNVLKYSNGTSVGSDYYVYDSKVAVDINTFAATAPEGYTYDGAFFYFTGHYGGQKVYVTSVQRDNNNTDTGSHLKYSGTLYNEDGSVDMQNGTWTYQASGVLHVVYVKKDEVHTVTFKDHCGDYVLNSYALKYSDANKGVSFSGSRVDDIDGFSTTITAHHNTAHPGYTFTNNWVVTGGGSGIDGTYTTEQLKSKITGWKITSDITITAQCTEPDVTIHYVAVGPEGAADFGSVTPTTETVKITESAKGSTATPGTGYKFVGWFKDEACTQPVDATWVNGNKIVPQKTDGKNVEATYYAKFECDVTSLTIRKDVSGNAFDSNERFVFTITCDDIIIQRVVVPANGSVTINGLKVGSTYTVTEETSWSWRYTVTEADNNPITLVADGTKNVVTFQNTINDSKWLTGDSYAKNIFQDGKVTRE